MKPKNLTPPGLIYFYLKCCVTFQPNVTGLTPFNKVQNIFPQVRCKANFCALYSFSSCNPQ